MQETRTNHCIRTALRLALAAGLLAVCVPIPLPSIPGISRPTTKSPPISDRRIDANGYCSQTEEDGLREQATLTTADNNVSTMQWQLWVGRRGSCQFDLSAFQQTRRHSSIELRGRYGNCTPMVQQDPRHVALAHVNCEAHCTLGIYEEAWPVMFDPQTGQYARNAQ